MRKFLVPLLIAAVLLAAMPLALNAQTTWQKFEHVWAKSLKTTGDATIGGRLIANGAIQANADMVVVGTHGISGDLNVTDDVVIVDTLTVTGTSNLVGAVTAANTFAANGDTMSVGKTMHLARQGAIAVTEGSIITPTGTFQELTAAGGVTATLADPATAGRMVILFNSTANAITIADGSGRYFAGNIVLGAYDSATLISTAQNNWMELDRSDN